MRIVKSDCNFEREPLIAPFGFKGGYLSELWQSVVMLEDDNGNQGIGLGVQSTLWSDPAVFTDYSESAGNGVMFLMTAFAAEQAKHCVWQTPIDILDQLLPLTYEYGKKITNSSNLRLTFALNSLVPVDNAAWLVYCKAKGIISFDQMVPDYLRTALPCRHDKLGAIPLLTYGVSLQQIKTILDEGYFFLKIKIGSDPNKDGNLYTMLEWDTNRLKEIHAIAGLYSTPYTDNGRIAYYLDANGRYNKEYLLRFLDYAQKIGAQEQIIIFEEPFAEACLTDVSDIPVCVAADESAHSIKESLERIELGYKAIALKPIAKTMSMSLQIAKASQDKKVSCFCADLTVNPVMVDWNKNVAARLAPLPGMKIGVLESNGHQNYKNWEQMKGYHPYQSAAWTNVKDGIFTVDNDFYCQSGGIFKIEEYYRKLVLVL
jgi:L-alanine-DL-glutamate epimerase-like enolase superfamily enzyme